MKKVYLEDKPVDKTILGKLGEVLSSLNLRFKFSKLLGISVVRRLYDRIWCEQSCETNQRKKQRHHLLLQVWLPGAVQSFLHPGQ